MNDTQRAIDALQHIPADLGREDWVRVGMAAKAAGLDFEAFDAWSQQGSSYKASDCRATWRSIKADGGVTAGTLFHLASEHGWRGGAEPATRRPVEATRRPPAPQRHTRLSDWGRRLWSQCRPISGAAEAYLEARRCVVPPADGDLRWHPSLKHPSGYTGPALVGLITDAATRAPLSLHRTWIRPDGTKPTDPAKMMLANHAIVGGVIRLWPDEAVTYGLAVAEGIETTLSLAWGYEPAWALIDAGHLAKFQPLAGIETLVIGRDNDRAGIDAARSCAAAWHAAGAEVRITRQLANDLNDVAQEVAA